MKKILAILLALSILAAFAACGAKNTPETTTEAESTEEITDEVTEEATEPESTEATSEDASATEASSEAATTEKASEAASEDASATDASETETTEAPKAPQTKEEIVAYFNEASNKVKTEAKSATRQYSKISLNGSTTLPSSLNTILKLLGGADSFLGDQLAKNSKTEPETFTGSQIKETYPVEGEAWSSKLTAAYVKSATCVEKDGKYVITITTVADGKSDSIKHGQGHAPKAFNVVLPGVVNDNIPGVAASMVGTATMNYPSSTVKAVIDPATGRVVSAVYDLYWTINFDKAGAILPFHTSDSWTIKY
ncbi:MAG: hypothetical protein IJM02_07035 [Clostridia bacterium]|nr:hypothetical protein [Clostridia bacterium]